MTEAIIILMNMRGGCAVGDKVHTLFRLNNRVKATAATLENPQNSVSKDIK